MVPVFGLRPNSDKRANAGGWSAVAMTRMFGRLEFGLLPRGRFVNCWSAYCLGSVFIPDVFAHSVPAECCVLSLLLPALLSYHYYSVYTLIRPTIGDEG